LVIMMGVATLSSPQSVRGRLGDVAALTSQAGIKPPAITVIGAVPDLHLQVDQPLNSAQMNAPQFV
jgi:siroheme synthase